MIDSISSLQDFSKDHQISFKINGKTYHTQLDLFIIELAELHGGKFYGISNPTRRLEAALNYIKGNFKAPVKLRRVTIRKLLHEGIESNMVDCQESLIDC